MPELVDVRRLATFEQVESVVCPKCGAKEGSQCANLKHPALAKDVPHMDRAQRFLGEYIHPRDLGESKHG